MVELDDAGVYAKYADELIRFSTVFALAISVYPDACTGALNCPSSSDEEQMDAIFAALAGPLSPES